TRLGAAGPSPPVGSLDGARHRITDLDPACLDQPDLRFLLQLLAPDLQALYRTGSDGADVVHLHTDDGSWAEVGTTPRNGRYPVTEVGARSIWTAAEHTARLWRHHGQPIRSRLGLTATIHGEHRIWLDDPSTPLGID